MAEISAEELNERVALIKRFKTLLQQQRQKFMDYLNVLEKQQDSISAENPDALLVHTELEQQIVKNISNLQKVIVPMQKMYYSVNNSDLTKAEEEKNIAAIQNELSDLQAKVLKQNQINRDLLRTHILQLKTQIENFKNPYKNLRSVYAQKQAVPQMVEVDA